MSEESSNSAATEETSPPPQPPLPAPPTIQPAASPFPKEQTEKKLISGILAILLGALGIHKFYLGYTTEGIIMLVVSIVGTVALCGIPLAPFAFGIIGIVEGILYLTKTDEEFVRIYVVGRKGWF